MSETRFGRSIYVRIAVGYVLLTALFLVSQFGLFFWFIERNASGRSPAVTRALADRLGEALAANGQLDLAEFSRSARPGDYIFIIMKDGRVAGERTPTPTTVRNVIEELNRSPDGRLPATWATSIYRPANVPLAGKTVGVLGIVPPTALERYGPLIGAIDLSLLAVGTLVAAGLIFGPVRRRIRYLQDAARRVGAGDLSARAPEDGKDEVAELAHAFNAMAEELSNRQHELDTSNRARRQLLADVSHELMTPLTSVLGNLETLQMAEVQEVQLDPEQRRRHVAVAQREAQRLERLVADLLDTARLEAGGGTLDIQNVPVAWLFDQVVAHHEYESRARTITMSVNISRAGLAVRGDAFRLEQAIENITANALRHTPEGGHISLSAELAGDTVVLTIGDSGEGILPDDLPLIFDRFYKASAARGIASRGSGLGLSIVKAIIQRHGGVVSASSVAGEGTVIRVELPAAPEASGHGREPRRESPAA
jgi:signal transduction histidine kinase